MNFDLNAKSSPQRQPRRAASGQKTSAKKTSPARNSSNRGASAQKLLTASVPISVYRELSAELQATQTLLDSLHGQNQNLRKQNVHLQQEVDSIVQAAQKMQHVTGGPKPGVVVGPSSMSSLVEEEVLTGTRGFDIAEGAIAQPGFEEAAPQPHQAQPGLTQPGLSRQRPQKNTQRHSQCPIASMPPCLSEPPRPQEMPITPDGIEPLAVRSPEALTAQHQPEPPNPNRLPQASSPFSLPKRQAAIEMLNKIFTGREQPLPQPVLDEESSEEIHTAWLVLIVLLIVVTAFGTGFMIVRPFLSTNR